MADQPPRLPNYRRDVEIPVTILRTIIVVVFVAAWCFILHADFFTRPTYMSIPDSPRVINWASIIICSPAFLLSGLVALAFWENAYTWVRKSYDDDVRAYHAYYDKKRQEREAAEQWLQHQRNIETGLQAEITRMKQKIADLQTRKRELSS